MRAYLPNYGAEGIEERLHDLLHGQWMEERKAEVATLLLIHRSDEWRTQALDVLDELLSADPSLDQLSPETAARVFESLSEAGQEGDDRLMAHAVRVADRGRGAARESAAAYVVRFAGPGS